MEPSRGTVEMIERLIAFDTTSRNSNLELIEFVQNYLTEHGVASELVMDPVEEKANLFATLGPTDTGGIALSGHTDVVPVDGQEWHSEPFQVTPQDRRLYGRGTADMKSFIAVCLSLVPEFLSRPIATPLHLVLSYDEEVGCMGVRSLVDQLACREVKPRACIVGEPTDMTVIRAHKGKFSCRARVRGLEAHSSLSHMGVNAVEAAAEAIAYLKGMARRFRAQGPHDPEYSPPYTTVHTGVVQGGTALNIVPKDCFFDFEFRHLPTDDPTALLKELKRHVHEHIEPEMKAVSEHTGFEFEESSQIPGLNTPEDEEVVNLAKALTGRNNTGAVSFGTEAGLFQEAEIPTVICGPGNIEQAHKPNEFITLEQVALCEQFLRRLFERCWEKN